MLQNKVIKCLLWSPHDEDFRSRRHVVGRPKTLKMSGEPCCQKPGSEQALVLGNTRNIEVRTYEKFIHRLQPTLLERARVLAADGRGGASYVLPTKSILVENTGKHIFLARVYRIAGVSSCI